MTAYRLVTREGNRVELELRHLFGYARRWWWLLLLLPLLAGGAAHTISARQRPLYAATTTLKINPARTGSDISGNIFAAQSLALTYQQVAASQPILVAAADRLGPPLTAEWLARMVSASTVRDSLLLRVAASDVDPVRAARVANVVAEEFANFVSSSEVATNTSSLATMDQLIAQAQNDVAGTAKQIQTLQANPDRSRDIQNQLDALASRLRQQEDVLDKRIAQKNDMELTAALSKNTVKVWVPAQVPDRPYAPRVSFYTLLGAFFGGLVAVAAVGLLEYLDNTVKAGLDFGALVGAPLLSVIGMAPKLHGGRDQLFVLERPKSNVAEAIRLLRTNVEFAAASREISSLAVTSAGPGEGKSTVTANLAAAMAQTGFSVAIVDADLRRPSQHRIFGVGNERGLTTLLMRPGHPWRWGATDVLPNLALIPSGPLPPNSADLLSSDRLRQLLAEIAESVDVVLLDTPPVLVVSDPLVVATNADAVFLVARAGRTRVEALRRAAASLQHGSARVIGIVLNQQTGRNADGYYYSYASDYYGPSDTPRGGSHPSALPPAGESSGAPAQRAPASYADG